MRAVEQSWSAPTVPAPSQYQFPVLEWAARFRALGKSLAQAPGTGDGMKVVNRVADMYTRTGNLPYGTGIISGVIAFSLAILCVLAVLAFHFPQYLTTPELRQQYSVGFLREALLVALILAGGLSLANIVLGRTRWLNVAALLLVLLAVAGGGNRVPVDPNFPDHTPYIGLDWFILDLLGSTTVFVAIEKIFPLYKAQPVFRAEWQTDFTHFGVNHFLVGLVLLIVNFLDYAFGTAVKVEQRFPEQYGVLGNYMPKGFLRQQMFPFTYREKRD